MENPQIYSQKLCLNTIDQTQKYSQKFEPWTFSLESLKLFSNGFSQCSKVLVQFKSGSSPHIAPNDSSTKMLNFKLNSLKLIHGSNFTSI